MILCSAGSRAGQEPLAGSAPAARLWVLLEQPGPWGPDAVVDSHLDPHVGRELKRWCLDRPVRLGLIRRVGRHADALPLPARRTLLIARSDPHQSTLRLESISDPRSVLDLDLSRLLDDSDSLSSNASRTLLVCTNAKRDRCCALLGRPLAVELEETFDGDVWETSHLGGHRFAPTVVSLPDGYLFGGPTAATLGTAACRGRSTLTPPEQVAEITALRHLGSQTPQAARLTPVTAMRWQVHLPGHEVLTVQVTTDLSPTDRAESCGKSPIPWQRLTGHVIN